MPYGQKTVNSMFSRKTVTYLNGNTLKTGSGCGDTFKLKFEKMW